MNEIFCTVCCTLYEDLGLANEVDDSEAFLPARLSNAVQILHIEALLF